MIWARSGEQRHLGGSSCFRLLDSQWRNSPPASYWREGGVVPRRSIRLRGAWLVHRAVVNEKLRMVGWGKQQGRSTRGQRQRSTSVTQRPPLVCRAPGSARPSGGRTSAIGALRPLLNAGKDQQGSASGNPPWRRHHGSPHVRLSTAKFAVNRSPEDLPCGVRRPPVHDPGQ